jgi:hypothetical protein
MRNRRQDFPCSWELITITSTNVISNLAETWCPHHKAFGVVLVARGRCVVMIVSRSWFIVVSDPLGGILLVGEGHKVEDQRMFRHQCKTPSELVVSIALTCCCKTIRVSQNAKQKARLSLVSGVDNNHIDEQEFETREPSFPTLSKFGVPITKRLVSYLLREVVALS